MASGIPEAVATANNWFPAKVTLLLSKESGRKSSYFKEGRTLPYEPSTAPERHPPSKRNGPGGTRTLTCTLARNCAAVTPQAHEPKPTSVRPKLRASNLHLLKQSFVLEQTFGWTAVLRLQNWGISTANPCDIQPCHPEGLQPIIVKPGTAESALGII
jgi:hypothetical protein